MKRKFVILAGGEGKRVQHILHGTAKQFTCTPGNEKTILEQTIERVKSLQLNCHGGLIVLGKKKFESEFTKIVNPSYMHYEEDDIAGTTAAIFHCLLKNAKECGDELFVFLPADHVSVDVSYFVQRLIKVIRLAEKSNKIFLLGSVVDNYSSDFGYIIPDRLSPLNEGVFFAKKFVEKPDQEVLNEMFELNPLLNMGIFIGKASSFFHAYISAARSIPGALQDSTNFDKDILQNLDISPVVVTYESSWSDYGSRLLQHDISNKEVEKPVESYSAVI